MYNQTTEKLFEIRSQITSLETQEVVRVEDNNDREYIWDGLKLYRLIPLKGKFGRKLNK